MTEGLIVAAGAVAEGWTAAAGVAAGAPGWRVAAGLVVLAGVVTVKGPEIERLLAAIGAAGACGPDWARVEAIGAPVDEPTDGGTTDGGMTGAADGGTEGTARIIGAVTERDATGAAVGVAT